MSFVAYLRDNLAGAWRVMLGRPEGLGRLDLSLEGFWRSFAAILLLVPSSLLSIQSDRLFNRNSGFPARLTDESIPSYGLALLVDWIAFPLIFVLVASAFRLGGRYVPFIVARNWASVVFVTLAASVDLLHLAGVLPSPAFPYAALITTAVAIYFSYVVAKTALGVSAAVALPIVFLDVAVSMTIWSAFNRFA